MLRSSTVAEIDAVAKEFERMPDRPDARMIRRPADPSKKRALQRLRTRAWRVDNDKRGRPTSETIVRNAVDGLVDRGFALSEIHDVMRKVRRRHRRAVDRSGEAVETAGAPLDREVDPPSAG
jgi:hypothetical protein